MSLVPTDFDHNRRFSTAMDINTTDSTVLANYDQHAVRLIHFSGMENEDFIEFKNRILDYIGVKNIKDETQKLYVLHSKLRSLARIEFDKLYSTFEGIEFDGALKTLETLYTGARVIQRKREQFEETYQMPGESPLIFLTRLTERAARCGVPIEDIHRKFKYGMLSEYFKHCMMNGAETHGEHLKLAQGYYKINHEGKVATVEPTVVSVPVIAPVPDITATAPTLDIATIKKLMEDVIEEKMLKEREQGNGYNRNFGRNRYYNNNNNRNNYGNNYNNNRGNYNDGNNYNRNYGNNNGYNNNRPQPPQPQNFNNGYNNNRLPPSNSNNNGPPLPANFNGNQQQITYYEDQQGDYQYYEQEGPNGSKN